MKTSETTKPLYQTLNKERTQGELRASTYGTGISLLLDKPNGETLYSFCEFPVNLKSDAQYTVLAVNNLHHLAEALQPFIKLADAVLKDTLKTNESPLYGYNDVVIYVKDLVAAKEALNRIS